MAQGGMGFESHCGFWWHAILTFSSVLGAKLSCPVLMLYALHTALGFMCYTENSTESGNVHRQSLQQQH